MCHVEQMLALGGGTAATMIVSDVQGSEQQNFEVHHVVLHTCIQVSDQLHVADRRATYGGRELCKTLTMMTVNGQVVSLWADCALQ